MERLHITIDDVTIRIFHFNFIQVNTYILYDKTKEAIIIDPGNSTHEENKILSDYIQKEGLSVKYIINTHPHIDHILGNAFCKSTYNVPLWAHEAGMPIYRDAYAYATSFNFQTSEFPAIDHFVNAGDSVSFGNQTLHILYTPGHCDGSICLWDKKHSLVFTGDVLFEENIGRADLPTGNLNLLIESIKSNLLTLDDSTLVFPGHGDSTTIGRERRNNPYL